MARPCLNLPCGKRGFFGFLHEVVRIFVTLSWGMAVIVICYFTVLFTFKKSLAVRYRINATAIAITRIVM